MLLISRFAISGYSSKDDFRFLIIRGIWENEYLCVGDPSDFSTTVFTTDSSGASRYELVLIDEHSQTPTNFRKKQIEVLFANE